MWSVALALASAMYISWIKMKNSMSYNKLVCLPRSSLLCDSQSPGVCLYFHSFMVGHEFHSHCDEETEEEGDESEVEQSVARIRKCKKLIQESEWK